MVATAGCSITAPANWGELRQGVVIWLDVAEDELLHRLQADPGGRPLLAGEDPAGRVHALLEQRQPLYGQADLRVSAQGEDASGISERILGELPGLLKAPNAPQTTAP